MNSSRIPAPQQQRKEEPGGAAPLQAKSPPSLNLQAGPVAQHRAAPIQRNKSAEERVLDRVGQYDGFIEEASATYGIPVTQIRSLISVESAGDPNASSGAAWGLMQITKGTWGDTQGRFPELSRYDFDTYWADPRINIMFGVATFKTKMKTVGVGTDDPNFASLAITAYNAGEGTVRIAIRNATNAGSQNPTADALKPEYLKPAIQSTRIYRYYLTGRGKRYNNSGTVEEAVQLKYNEVSRYPTKVQKYLALQDDGNTTADPTTGDTDSSSGESTTPIGSGTVTAQGLNIRSGPGTSFGKVGSPLTQDASVTIYGEQDGWYQIGEGRWASAKHIAMVATPVQEPETDRPKGTGKITASALNVRSGPGTGFGTVGSPLRQDAEVTIFSEQDGWYKIGDDRWISGKFVEMTEAAPENEQASGPIDSGTVTAAGLNVRSGPAGTYAKAGDALTQGARIDVYEKKDGWLRIGEDQLWVSGKHVELGSQTGDTTNGGTSEPAPVAEEKKGFVTASSLNVRSGIGTGNPIVRRLTRNQSVTILEEKDSWVRIGDNEWVSGQFIQPGSPTSTGSGNGPKPRWISVAEGEIGQKEIKGSRHNPRVIEYHATTGRFGTDEVPWCASFANWVMRQAGQPETGSALAMSFSGYGKRLNRPAYGALAVFSYGGGKGHVGFVVGKQGDRILVLGGNQSDSVKISSFSTSKIHAYVVPDSYDVPAEAYNLGGSGDYDDGGGVAATR